MKSALVVEGGAMRGIFAAGVLDKFMEHDYYAFDFTLGVSAGATNLSTYVSKMPGLSKTIITQYATKREFFSPLRFIKGGHMTDVHWLWHHSKQSMNMFFRILSRKHTTTRYTNLHSMLQFLFSWNVVIFSNPNCL